MGSSDIMKCVRCTNRKAICGYFRGNNRKGDIRDARVCKHCRRDDDYEMYQLARNRSCIDCKHIAKYKESRGNRIIYCYDHKKIDSKISADGCEHEHCDTRATFNTRGSSEKRFCKDHAPDHMVSVEKRFKSDKQSKNDQISEEKQIDRMNSDEYNVLMSRMDNLDRDRLSISEKIDSLDTRICSNEQRMNDFESIYNRNMQVVSDKFRENNASFTDVYSRLDNQDARMDRIVEMNNNTDRKLDYLIDYIDNLKK